jgi:hypothetical protein
VVVGLMLVAVVVTDCVTVDIVVEVVGEVFVTVVVVGCVTVDVLIVV